MTEIEAVLDAINVFLAALGAPSPTATTPFSHIDVSLQQHLQHSARPSARRDTPHSTMAPAAEAKGRYPKRKRAEVDYDVDKSFADVSDLESDDGYYSEELGEDTSVSAADNSPAGAVDAQQTTTITVVEVDSEYEDATFGTRKKLKKRKVVTKVMLKGRSQPKPKPPPKWMPFRLMDLPPELRLKVYEEALVDPHGVTVRSYSDRWETFPVHVAVSNIRSPYPNPKWYVRGEWTLIPDNELPKKKNQLSPNLLAASKTIYAEAVSYLWTQPFLFTDVQGLNAFLMMLRPETISRLRSITILQNGWTNHKILPAFVLLRDAPFLENLRIDCRIRPDIRPRSGMTREVSMGQQLATKLYSNCHPFLKALVKHNGEESIIKVLKFTREEFKNNYYDHVTNRWVREDWSQEREDEVLRAMTAELREIMKRTVTPKFPRSRW